MARTTATKRNWPRNEAHSRCQRCVRDKGRWPSISQLHQEIHALCTIPASEHSFAAMCDDIRTCRQNVGVYRARIFRGSSDRRGQEDREHRYDMGVSSALRHLHDHRFAHVDVKPDNVTMDATQYRCKLIDRIWRRCTGAMCITAGTVQYAAPECTMRSLRNLSMPLLLRTSGRLASRHLPCCTTHIFQCAHVSDVRFLRFLRGRIPWLRLLNAMPLREHDGT